MDFFSANRRRILKNDLPLYNIFIGGVSAIVPDIASLATRFNIPESSISNFTIVGTNVFCRINIDFNLPPNCFQNVGALTYLIASEGNITSIGTSLTGNDFQLFGTPNCNHVISEKVLCCGRQAMQNNGERRPYYPLLYRLGNVTFRAHTIDRGYFPSLTEVHVNAFDTVNNRAGQKIYVNPYLATSNAGGVDPGIQNFITRGGTVIWVMNFNKPGKVTGLSVSTAGVVTLTPPSSLNTLDFYEVQIDDGTNNPVHLYTTFKEITASGQSVGALAVGTKVKVRACDIYWNRGEFSDPFTII